MQFFPVQGIWYWCSEMSGKNLSQPPGIVMSMKVDNVAIEVGVFDGEFCYRCFLTILEDAGFNQLASPTLAVMLRIENEIDILFRPREF